MSSKPDTTEKPRDLAGRLFENLYFTISWIAFLAAVMRFVSWPLRDCVLVCWVYGRDAYFRDGVRVVSAKPTVFSTGASAPQLPNLITGFGAFIVTAFGLSLLLVSLLRFYERRFKRSHSHAA
jgi:hypothetical protein